VDVKSKMAVPLKPRPRSCRGNEQLTLSAARLRRIVGEEVECRVNQLSSYNSVLPLHHLEERIRHLRWCRGDTDSRRFEGCNLCCRRPSSATHNRSSVAHPSSWRRGRASDKACHRFLAILLDPLSGFLFSGS